jgi:uncharacterized protein YdcH (DUF465 family)
MTDLSKLINHKNNLNDLISDIHTLRKVIPSEKLELEKMRKNLIKLDTSMDIILKTLSIYK